MPSSYKSSCIKLLDRNLIYKKDEFATHLGAFAFLSIELCCGAGSSEPCGAANETVISTGLV